MARLSLGSQHFHAKENVPKTSRNAQTLNLPNPEIEEYITQNKSLAVRNAELTLKVADLEARVQQLEDENALLQCKREFDTESTFRVQSVLDQAETLVADLLGTFVEKLNHIRVQEHVQDSVLLQTLLSALSACRPVTSTPRTERDYTDGESVLWAGIPLQKMDESGKERSVSVASLADLAMIDDLCMELQNNVGNMLLPELSTKVAVFSDLTPIKEEPKTDGHKAKEQKGKRGQVKKAEARKPRERRRRPLSNVTNRRRALRSRTKVEEVPDDIFDFVDETEA